MGLVAEELGLNRTTLHRWFASRDDLLGQVLSDLSRIEFARALAGTRAPRGTADRVISVLERFLRSQHESAAFQAFLAREPATAARVLMTAAGGVEQRSRGMVEALLEEEAAAGLALTAPVDVLSVALIRVGEAFLYADIISEGEPDVSRAVTIFRLLLR